MLLRQSLLKWTYIVSVINDQFSQLDHKKSISVASFTQKWENREKKKTRQNLSASFCNIPFSSYKQIA